MTGVRRDCWCGARLARPIGTFADGEGAGLSLVRCAGCGVVALHPAPDDARLHRAYSSEYYGRSRRKFVGPVAGVVSVFQRARVRRMLGLVPPGGRVLDIGCGNGEFLRLAARRGLNVEGTEWTAESAARVPARWGIPVHVGDLLDLDLPDAAYDAVALWHVLEHVRRPAETIARVARLLKPGGWLVVSVPNVDGAPARRWGLAWFHHDPPRHLHGFGRRSLVALLDAHGFRARRIRRLSLEQDTFGELQSRLNARGLPRDQLYTQLKGLSRTPAPVALANMARLAVAVVPATLRALADAAQGDSGTLTIYARRVTGGPVTRRGPDRERGAGC